MVRSGDSLQYFLPFEFSLPKKAPFCDFSDFVLFYVLFRNKHPVVPIMNIFLFNFLRSEKFPIVYKFLSLLGCIRFCTKICPFYSLVAARNPRIYRNGRGRGICSDFVFILFIFGNMIQKSLFVYY